MGQGAGCGGGCQGWGERGWGGPALAKRALPGDPSSGGWSSSGAGQPWRGSAGSAGRMLWDAVPKLLLFVTNQSWGKVPAPGAALGGSSEPQGPHPGCRRPPAAAGSPVKGWAGLSCLWMQPVWEAGG